jgi:pyrroloquinoline quinone (PQQ) biosynthesis protein C
MREATLTSRQAEAFLVDGWPVVEQFPQYMAMNLQKLRYGHSRGQDLARPYMTRNIRVEQNHADNRVDWAAALTGQLLVTSRKLSIGLATIGK